MKLRDIPVLSVPVVCLIHYVTSFLWRYTNLYHYKVTPPYYEIHKIPGKKIKHRGQRADVAIDMALGDNSDPHESRHSDHVTVTMADNQMDLPTTSEDASEPKVSWLQRTWQYAKSKLKWSNYVSNVWVGAWAMAKRTVTGMMTTFKMPFYFLHTQLRSITAKAIDDQCEPI